MDHRAHLREAASPRVICGAHVLSFQPSSTPNEDRWFVNAWPLKNGTWKLLAIFDGHGAGTEAVGFVLATLPNKIESALRSELKTAEDIDLSDEIVEEILIWCIRDVDLRIQNEFTALLPAPSEIGDLAQEAIEKALHDTDSDEGDSRVEVLRARTGATALVALVDPKNAIHVASLGDSDAVLATKEAAIWRTEILSARHNCANDSEVERIRAEHPGEAGCVNTETQRTLGLIAITRGEFTACYLKLNVVNYASTISALGDTLFKLPAVYTERVAPLSRPPMHPNYDLNGLAVRNLTPPYLSNIAEVTHAAPLQSGDAQRLLILASDGLAHVLSRCKDVWDPFTAADVWYAAAVSTEAETGNMALNVLWDSLQPEDGENLYKRMVKGKYRGRVDDITIIVCPL